MKNKSHNHVPKSRAFSKGLTVSELTLTPTIRAFTESRNKLVFGHSPQTLIIGVVRMLYLRDMEHIGYNIWCDHNTHTLNASNKRGTK